MEEFMDDIGSQEAFYQKQLDDLTNEAGIPLDIASDGIRRGMLAYEKLTGVDYKIQTDNVEADIVAVLIRDILLQANIDKNRSLLTSGMMTIAAKHGNLAQFMKVMLGDAQ
jgi:hypothetical protein